MFCVWSGSEPELCIVWVDLEEDLVTEAIINFDFDFDFEIEIEIGMKVKLNQRFNVGCERIEMGHC